MTDHLRPADRAAVHGQDAVLVRDSLRDLFALLGISAAVQCGTVGTRRTVVVSPLALGDARVLVRALDRSDDTRPGRAR